MLFEFIDDNYDETFKLWKELNLQPEKMINDFINYYKLSKYDENLLNSIIKYAVLLEDERREPFYYKER